MLQLTQDEDQAENERDCPVQVGMKRPRKDSSLVCSSVLKKRLKGTTEALLEFHGEKGIEYALG